MGEYADMALENFQNGRGFWGGRGSRRRPRPANRLPGADPATLADFADLLPPTPKK